MQELVDKIYGVENEIIDRAKQRFKVVNTKMSQMADRLDVEADDEYTLDKKKVDQLRNQISNF